MRFEVGRKRIGLAAGSFFLVLCAITVGLIVIAAALISSQGTGSLPANSNTVRSISSLGSSSVSSNSSSTTAQPAVQTANQSTVQYPLVWAPKPVGVACDSFPFCIEAVLGFAGHTATTSITTTATTVIQDNTTTIVFDSTTTYMSGVSTGVVYPPDNAAIAVSVWAFVQDAATGQNVTTDNGSLSYIGGDCGIHATGFTNCYAGGSVPPGHTYKVTVYVTEVTDGHDLLPCSIRPASLPNLSCTTQLLAPIQTVTITE
jgi:cytoskeletal protein RodZ